ncbi:MAG: sigma-70 family RNA polymerase sigma factor [Pirellulaceae bacterium]
MTEHEAIEQAITRIQAGEKDAVSQLIELAFRRLYEIAERIAPSRGKYGPTPTLHTTALVQEGVMRLYDNDVFRFVNDANHFYAIFSTATKHALIDYGRFKNADKRGGKFTRQPLDVVLDQLEGEGIDPVELRDEFDHLRSHFPRSADVLEMFYFGRLTVAEIASALDVSISTIESDLRFARAFLRRNLTN